MPEVGLIVAVHTVSTLFMTGVIWFVQVVHYPLFAAVPVGAFAAYESHHTRRATWLVAPAMVVEAVTAALLAVRPLDGMPAAAPWTGLVLVAVVWLSTSLFQVPCHRRLSHGFSPEDHRRLVLTNWIRTAAWSLRSILAVWISAVWAG